MISVLGFAVLSTSLRAPPLVNLYDMAGGNWTRRINNVTSYYYPMAVVSSVIEDGKNITVFAGEYEGTDVQITVTSNTTAQIKYGELEFEITMIQKSEGIAYAEADLSDGSHITLTTHANRSFELVIVPKGSSDIITIGLFKKREQNYSFKDFVIPTVIALGLTIIVRKVLPKYLS